MLTAHSPDTGLSPDAAVNYFPTQSPLLAPTPNGKLPKPPGGRIVNAGEFEAEAHFYPRVLNAQIHPLVASFFALGNERIIARYVHLNPQINEDKLREVLSYKPQNFAWAGVLLSFCI